VGIAHSHFYVVMAQNFLERKDIPARHHKVCCKRMAQDVGKLRPQFQDLAFGFQ
jgi:hypothetical protein